MGEYDCMSERISYYAIGSSRKHDWTAAAKNMHTYEVKSPSKTCFKCKLTKVLLGGIVCLSAGVELFLIFWLY